MNNEPSYIIINLDGVRINKRLRSGVTLLPLVPKMTGSWRVAECTSPICLIINIHYTRISVFFRGKVLFTSKILL